MDWVQIKFDTNKIEEAPKIVGSSAMNPHGKYIHENDYEHIAKQNSERSSNMTRIGMKAAAAMEALDEESYDVVQLKLKEIQYLTRHYMPVDI